MKTKILRNIFLSVGVLFASAQLLPAGTFTTFDPPGSTFTQPSGITPGGVITGFYIDASGATPGFVRAPDGTITTFDGPNDIFGTFPSGINSAGVITGEYCDAVTCHGFLRARDGSFTTFDPPGSIFTDGVGINERGVVTGQYADAAFNPHSFVRALDGTFATFDPAMLVNLSGVINPAGAIVGYFFTPSPPFVLRGFVRDPKGVITIFDAPNVCQTSNGTFAEGINPAGVIVGTYVEADCVTGHGFLRSPNGAFTNIDVPGAPVGATEADAINPGGAISGIYFNSSGGISGFLRSPSGSFTTYSFPGNGQGGVSDKAINPAGAITGVYCDTTGCHGYLWTP